MSSISSPTPAISTREASVHVPQQPNNVDIRLTGAGNSEQLGSSIALHPATETFACGCGKSTCAFASLQPFRDHIARLYRAVAACDSQGAMIQSNWQAVLYPLQMAASLEDVRADTAYVDDSLTIVYCSGAAAYESAQTEMARQYIAALTVFTFLWSSYEAAVDLTFPDKFVRLCKDGRNGERGRRLFDACRGKFPSLRALGNLIRLAEMLCQRGNLFDQRLHDVQEKCAAKDLVLAAELCREFRNFIVHGEDQVPQHENWHRGRVPGESRARICRFYAIGRLLLLLIQSLAFAGVSSSVNDIEWGFDEDDEPLTSNPRRIFESLHLLKSSLE